MENTKIEVFDFQRILFGELPLTFPFEIAFRTVIMYLYLLLMIRFIGKRSMSQLSPFEFSLLIALGSAVGDPMFYHDVPLLYGLVVMTVVILVLKILVYATEHNRKIENLIKGKVRCVLKDGVVINDEIDKENFSSEELFGSLRESGIKNLGEVERAYIETSGKVSVFSFDSENIRPGLLILPPEEDYKSFEKGQSAKGLFCCCKCGNTLELMNSNLPDCSECNESKWTYAR